MKTSQILRLVLPVLAMLFATMTPAAYLESDSGETVVRPAPQPPPEPPPRVFPPPVIVPAPERDNPLVSLVRRVEIGGPTSYRGLTIYPLLIPGRGTATDALTLDEALARRDLMIREKGEGQVAFVQVRNEARQPVFLMTGELLLGGRQNRVIRDDTLLPARSEFLDVPVYCGEQDRWQGPEPVFKSGSTMSAPALREMAAGAASQDRIWGEIDGQLQRAEVKSATRSYQALYDDKAIRERLDDCVGRFRRIWNRQTIGLVVTCGDRILGGDLFADPELCSRLWEKIVRSYAGDVVIMPQYREWDDHSGLRKGAPVVGRDDVQRFLDRIRTADYDARNSAGLGRLYSIRGGVTGNVLINTGEVVHAAVFTGTRELFVPQPTPMPGPRPLLRRDIAP